MQVLTLENNVRKNLIIEHESDAKFGSWKIGIEFKQKVWQGINLDFHEYIWRIILLFHHHCRWHLVRPVSRVESLTERAQTVLTRPAFFFFLLPHKASVQEQLWGEKKGKKKLLTDNNSFSARVFSCCYNDITVRSGTFKAISPGIGGGGSECKNTL